MKRHGTSLVIPLLMVVFALVFAAMFVVSIPAPQAEETATGSNETGVAVASPANWTEALKVSRGVVLMEFVPPAKFQRTQGFLNASITVRATYHPGRLDPPDEVHVNFGYNRSLSTAYQYVNGKEYVVNEFFSWSEKQIVLKPYESRILTWSIVHIPIELVPDPPFFRPILDVYPMEDGVNVWDNGIVEVNPS